MKSNKKQIQQNIEQVTTLHRLMTAYEEIAALRMKRIREQVLKSRDFHAILSHYFHEIKHTHTPQQPRQSLPAEGRPLAILISDDKGLYGEILQKTKDAFETFAQEHGDYELAVVGTVYEESIKQALTARSVHFFPLSGSTLSPDALRELMQLLSQFPRVTVFHGKFSTFVTQTPQSTNITGDEETVQEAPEVPIQYVLEPSHDSLMTFFQQEIVSLLFEQALLEGTLSKEASRMVNLEQASDNARSEIKKLNRLTRILEAQNKNKQQITYLAGLSLWQVH